MGPSFWFSVIAAVTTGANFVIMLQVRLALQTIKTEIATQRAEDEKATLMKIENARHTLRNEMQAHVGIVSERLRDVELILAKQGHDLHAKR